MQEIIDWIDRELSRLDMVIAGSEWGLFTVDADKIIAQTLNLALIQTDACLQ